MEGLRELFHLFPCEGVTASRRLGWQEPRKTWHGVKRTLWGSCPGQQNHPAPSFTPSGSKLRPGRYHRPGVGSRLALVRQDKNPLCHPMFEYLTKSGTQIVSFEFTEATPVPEGASASLGKADESQIFISVNSDSVI